MSTSTNTSRPSVELVVARFLRTGEVISKKSPDWKRVRKVLDFHGIVNPTKTVYACLACQSVGECESQMARDLTVDHYDWTCCEGYTVTFKTEQL